MRAPPAAVRLEFEAAIPDVQRFAARLTRDREKGQELAQQALARAWEHIHQFIPGTRMKAWLFTITRHEHYEVFRKRRHEVEDPDGIHAARLLTRPRVFGIMHLTETLEAMERLMPIHREAIVMSVAGMEQAEQAERAGIAQGTAKSRLSRARVALTEALGGEDGWSGEPEGG